ncbi:4Fe-4S dicluster domain-containing protein [Pseudoflavonifractor sp. MSJ-37]|uniref:4Fe-4S dicluster domain-containing protein n=1 Tax=Pseudoflavonifractor sp. MSJ-37 TaxID=2841531 RepID=UPI001C127292|nr:4Fe-4S dicluster domain-containing protein [Pseudoflavonifractor sp. MSJ-37]MBU5434243.1 4Fe-4S dicluster domain-containing protein [Pseudoflavonifractor sp. MSJ-37]
MRGMYTSVTEIRRNIFTEIARMAYEGGDYAKTIEALPYKILPGEQAQYRESIFLERAIVGERLRLAMGLPVRSAAASAPISAGIEESTRPEKYYEPPLINIIKFACHACPEKRVISTEACQGCLSHPCTLVCPKDAIHIENGRSVVDQDKCIKCGRCVSACPYNAIVKQERPCAAACGVKAIGSDELGRADIDYDKCVSCGMCLVNCPFGAIADKSQIFQLIAAIKSDVPVYAAVAPAFVDQFGPKVTPEKLRAAMKELGFTDVIEVAVGADLCASEEATDFVKNVPENLPFMATSCCPAWSSMAKKQFPEQAKCVSMALTPMVLTGRLIKMDHPDAKVAFIGPCAAKKLEAMRKSVRSDIDFVLTFEEMMGLFNAKSIDIENIPAEEFLSESSADGRNFAVSGGVAQAVVHCVQEMYPEVGEIKVASAQGLEDCRKMMLMAKTGKYDGYLLEGMACPGGCVAGAGSMQPIEKSALAVTKYAKKAEKSFCCETDYLKDLARLEE